MLRGALHTFHDGDNPERIAQTAHSIREVMEKLVLWGDRVIRAPGPTLGDRVRELAKVVDRARDESPSHIGARWDGPIDGLVRRMLVETENLVDGFRKERPSRRQRALEIMQTLGPAAGPLPGAAGDTLVEEWQRHEDYFTKVSHHADPGTPDEFDGRVQAWIQFMLARLRPPTLETQRKLDEIVRKAEQDA